MEDGTTAGTAEGAATPPPPRTEEPRQRRRRRSPGLDLIGLTKIFPGGAVAVDDVNLHVDHGEYVVLLGPSGCGKTTTLRMIGGHEYPTEGDILLDGESLVDARAAQAADDDRLPALRALPAQDGARERRVRAQDARRAAGTSGASRRSDALEMVGLDRARRAQAARALGRPAAARRARPRARDEAEGAPARRAARRPRPAAAAADARRAAQPPAPARPDVHPRHAQPGGSAVDGRPDRRHERRADPAGRRPAHDRHQARDRARRPLHGRQQHHPRPGRRAARRPARRGRRATTYARPCSRPRRRTRVGDEALRRRARGRGRGASTRGGDAGQTNSAEARDRLRRVPRRPGEAPSRRQPGSACSRRFPASATRELRGKEGEKIRIAWKEEDVQLLRP